MINNKARPSVVSAIFYKWIRVSEFRDTIFSEIQLVSLHRPADIRASIDANTLVFLLFCIEITDLFYKWMIDVKRYWNAYTRVCVHMNMYNIWVCECLWCVCTVNYKSNLKYGRTENLFKFRAEFCYEAVIIFVF